MQYQILQQDSRSKVSTHWTVVSIFIGVNTALIGGVAYILNNKSDNTQWIVLFLGLAFIGIFICLWSWLNRVNGLLEYNDSLMLKIEKSLEIEERKKPPGNGSKPIKGIYVIFMILWVVFIILAFIFSAC